MRREHEEGGMTDQARAERIARHIFEAHQQRARFERLRGELAPASLAEAYLVQDAVHRRFSAAGWGVLGGHKIALTSRAVQELCGVDQPAGGGDLRQHHPHLARDAAR